MFAARTICIALIGASSGASIAQPGNRLIVISGDPAPDGNGVFDRVTDPVVDESGFVTFSGFLLGTSGGSRDDAGLFGDAGAGVFRIMREGDAPPDGGGTFTGGGGETVVAGRVAFKASIRDSPAWPDDNSGLYRWNANGNIQKLIRKGDTVPGGGRIGSDGYLFSNVAMNGSGLTAFYSRLVDTPGGETDDSAILLADGSTVHVLAREGQVLRGAGQLRSFSIAPTAINEAGQVAFFSAARAPGISAMQDRQMLIIGDSAGLNVIAAEGQPSPDGNGVFDIIWFSRPNITDSGSSVFLAEVRDVNPVHTATRGVRGTSGIFLWDSDELRTVARSTDRSPDGNGAFSNFRLPKLSNRGTVLFQGIMRPSLRGSLDNSGLFTWREGSLDLLLREGESTPTGNGVYDHFETELYTINDDDQVAFMAWLRDTAADDDDDYGLFFHDPGLGTFEVIREGDRIDGVPVVWVWLSADEGVGSSGLGPNQVAYRFLLADDRQGVAVWTAP